MNELIRDVQFNNLRLPYYSELADTFAIDNVGWKVLTETIFPSARSVDSIIMALTYCRRRELDVFKRPVHIVPMWSSSAGKMIETVWPGISELRTTAFRTGQYAGCDEAEFGPDVTRVFEGKCGRGTKRGEERKVEVTFPKWCRVKVHRVVKGTVVAFVGPKVDWLESYAKWADTDVPNDMWAKRPLGQIEKCAEAAALRRSFPEEIGSEYAAEEMEGQRVFDNAPAALPQAAIPPVPPVVAVAGASVAAPLNLTHEPQEDLARGGMVVDAEKVAVAEDPYEAMQTAQTSTPTPPKPPAAKAPTRPTRPAAKAPAPPVPPAAKTQVRAAPVVQREIDPEGIIREFQDALDGQRDAAGVYEVWNDIVTPFAADLFPPDLTTLTTMRDKKLARFS